MILRSLGTPNRTPCNPDFAFNNLLVDFLLNLISIKETDIGNVVVILHFRCELKSVCSHDVLIVD